MNDNHDANEPLDTAETARIGDTGDIGNIVDLHDVVAQHIDLDGSVVVDVGSGAGELVRFLRSSGAEAIGVECGDVMLQRALAADPDHPDSYRNGVGQDLPVESETADAVIFSYSLHHVPAEEMTTALKEAQRVLKPGGTLYVVEPIPTGPSFESNRLIDDETVVRGLAQDALESVPELGFELRTHSTFDSEYSYESAEAWEALLVGIDPSRKTKMDQHREEARQRFFDNATERDGSYVFRQPNDLKVYTRQ